MSNERVLVVEDEADARELLVRGLERLGWHVAGASDGEEARRMLDAGWNAVVTDIRMPRMDGLLLLSHIRVLCPGALRVVITSFGDKDHVLQALNQGADYLIEKPFSAQQVSDLLKRLLQEQGGDKRIDQLFIQRLSNLPLSERERNVVVLVLKGYANRDIATSLNMGEQSVKNALVGIYAKLGVSSRGGLFHHVFPV
ncbi:MAG: response regulator transcription factor [Planctomycetota bacterium]